MRTAITGVRAIGVPVTDRIEPSTSTSAPWASTCGWTPPSSSSAGAGSRWRPRDRRPGGTTGVETGIRLTTADAASLHQELVTRGGDVGELLRWDGVPPMSTVRDPDGNGLEIVQ
jgi:lactoylglutathione lyase